MKRQFQVAVVLTGVALVAFAQEAPTQAIGIVRSSQGSVSIRRDGQAIDVAPGTPLLEGDELRTGESSSIGFYLHDDTVISLGANAQFTIKSFTFDPAKGRFGFVGKLIRGAAAFISGKITKHSPESAVVETPDATIGVRGTHFAVRVDGK